MDITKFKDLKIELKYEAILDKHADATVDKLKVTSPKSGRPNRKTPYSEGWEVQRAKLKKGYRCKVWNRTNYQLTHLLENGHFVTNVKKHPNLVWVAPQKHIRKASDEESVKLMYDMINLDLEVSFKK